MKFIADFNVGKLARWLRMMGCDTLFFHSGDDSSLVKQALAEGRTILTRDTGIMKRGTVTSGRVGAILLESEEPEQQMKQLLSIPDLKAQFNPFTLCLECNQPLEAKTPAEVAGRVPPYVFRTQKQYMECSRCHRIYWRGTHWQAMVRKMEKLVAMMDK
jgi:uncharacterized protein with PIN domain